MNYSKPINKTFALIRPRSQKFSAILSIVSSQINAINFEISYREGPQKLKILSFLWLGAKTFWIDIQFCRHKLYQILIMFFQSEVLWSKQWPHKKLRTLKSESTQNSIWRLDSTYFLMWKQPLVKFLLWID